MISIGNLEADDEANIEMLFYAMGLQKTIRVFDLLQQQRLDGSVQLG